MYSTRNFHAASKESRVLADVDIHSSWLLFLNPGCRERSTSGDYRAEKKAEGLDVAQVDYSTLLTTLGVLPGY